MWYGVSRIDQWCFWICEKKEDARLCGGTWDFVGVVYLMCGSGEFFNYRDWLIVCESGEHIRCELSTT